MIIIEVLAAIVLLMLVITVYYSRKFYNPYKLIFIFGKKGTGKSTTLCKLAYQYSRKGWTVYSTEDTPNSRRFNPRDFGTYKFPENSLILIDEVSLIWSNRDFKTFSKNVEKQFRLQRHDRLVIYLFSQSFDVDIKIRGLADSMYLAVKYFNCITYLKKIDKHVVLTKSDSTGASRIAEDLTFEPFLLCWLGTRHIVWIPKWAKLFDSFSDLEWQRADMPYEETRSARPGLQLRRHQFRVTDGEVDGEVDGDVNGDVNGEVE